MQKISKYIFGLSPKKLTIYLVLGPMLLFLAHTITTISFRTISNSVPKDETLLFLILGVLLLFLIAFVLLWFFWLISTVYSIEEVKLGLARKWFKIACFFFVFFVIFNAGIAVIETLWGENSNEYLHLIKALREFINFGGILIAYPIICHYAARATMVKRTEKPATFIGSMPFTLVLMFGTVLGIPFMHTFFSPKTSTNSEVITIYVITGGLFIFILVIGFIAAITGMV